MVLGAQHVGWTLLAVVVLLVATRQDHILNELINALAVISCNSFPSLPSSILQSFSPSKESHTNFYTNSTWNKQSSL
eukprot:COSAG02_NODE_20911_length_810_cov_1.139241_1_plen_76_part_10